MIPLTQIPPLSAERFEAMRASLNKLPPLHNTNIWLFLDYIALRESDDYRKWLGQQASFWREAWLATQNGGQSK